MKGVSGGSGDGLTGLTSDNEGRKLVSLVFACFQVVLA